MHQVSLIKCSDYNLNEVHAAMVKALNLLGGINKFVKKNETI